MRWRISVMIGSALGSGMLASMLVANWTAPRPAEPPPEATTRIYVALRDLPDGAAIDERNVALVRWPTRGLPPGVVEQIDDVKRRLTDGRIAAGQPIQLSRLKSSTADATAGGKSDPSAAAATTAPPTVSIELGQHGSGPWLVSTGETLNVTPLEAACRQAAELARRTETAPTAPVVPSPAAVETPPQTLGEPIATTAAERGEAGGVQLHVEEIPWASSIVTPEGAKILRWRDPAELAPAATGARTPKLPAGTTSTSRSSAPLANNALAGRFCDLSGATLAGREFDWESYRGRPVLVVVHLARHAAGREELALVERVAESYRRRGLAVVGVGLDEDLETVRALARNNRINWPIVVGPDVRQWARTAGLDQPLTLLVVDEAGRVANVGHRVGDVTHSLALACDDAGSLPSVRQARRGETP